MVHPRIDCYLVAVRAVGDARGMGEGKHDADMAWVGEVAEHERVVKTVTSAGAAVDYHGVMILQAAAAAERTPAEVDVTVDFVVFQTPAVDVDDEAVIESVEHQPRSLLVKQAAVVLVTCITTGFMSIK